ncbi:hypothetical protein [Bradyrhizobium sp.]|uniref:hypothetical protein n=1 Tax=Bradyrhizobium sp. TaxID=376 RepID=UPI002DDD5F57|nr:hypothetical protein [Bradyrhizobium sp.]HEV2155455.1 hypothetical protein [Bradyrhizobium sp.]
MITTPDSFSRGGRVRMRTSRGKIDHAAIARFQTGRPDAVVTIRIVNSKFRSAAMTAAPVFPTLG